MKRRPEPILGSWSQDFKNFINDCLTNDADLRPDAKTLLAHPFFQELDEANFKKEFFDTMRLTKQQQSEEEIEVEGK